jgi:hypothetical protein
MTNAPPPPYTRRWPVARAVVVTWLVTAVWDFLCASALSVIAYRAVFTRFWRGIASVPVGPKALEMGTLGFVAGVATHFMVALTWSALFVLAVSRSRALQRALRHPAGAVTVAAVYGPLIWLAMSLAAIPLATGRPPVIGFRWWVQIFAHLPFVTLPLVFTARQFLGLSEEGGQSGSAVGGTGVSR